MVRIRSAVWLLSAVSALAAQAPVADAGAVRPHCAAPTHWAPSVGVDNPDCDWFQTNPTAAYAPTSLLRIPVVVHVIQSTTGQGALTDAQVRSQIAVLNEDYRALPGTAGAAGVDTRIEFFLANLDANGQPTTGITRHVNDTWFADQGDYWTPTAWDTARFLNLYTNSAQAFGAGALGYTVMPQSPQWLNTPQDRVVILWSVFGRPGAPGPYALGRVCTHEVGHYLGLFHTHDFGCDVGNCHASGDRICDTAPEAVAHYDCVTAAASCGAQAAPTDNYMSAADDACLQRFTPEQARRMRCTLQSYRPSLARLATPSAAATSRAGAGNRNTAYTITPPRIGQTCTAQVTTMGSGYSLAAVVGFLGSAALPFEAQTLLVDPAAPCVLQLPLASGAYVVGWAVPIPNALVLAGTAIATQGVLLGNTIALTNAMDVVIGN